jgi:hypothetical protein
MSILPIGDQYKYNKRGPLDAKALVRTYAELLDVATWTIEDTMAAYNGMVTAVWLNKDDTTKNGLYFFHDPVATSALKVPDVTNEANWHKLCNIDELQGLTSQITLILGELNPLKDAIEALKDTATVIVALKEQLPEVGAAGKLYVVTEEATTYIWHNGVYLSVGDGVGDSTLDVQVIMGGGPTT